MKLLNTIFTICIIILIFMFLTSCTVKFKAQELEFDYEQTRIYEFDGFDVFGIPIVKSTGPKKPRFDSGLPKAYAFK